jgi:hypothetical protein
MKQVADKTEYGYAIAEKRCNEFAARDESMHPKLNDLTKEQIKRI